MGQDVFVTRGTLVRILHDNTVSYRSCINKDCNRKVEEKPSGGFMCPKCEEIPRCDHRYILSTTIADHTGYAYVTAFHDSALTLLDGVQASELPDKVTNTAAYDAVFTDASFKMYKFTIRAKMDNYKDENRLKNSIVSVEKLNFVEESKRLLQEISQF
jgi:replication factor A1